MTDDFEPKEVTDDTDEADAEPAEPDEVPDVREDPVDDDGSTTEPEDQP